MLNKVFKKALTERMRLGDVCREMYNDGRGSDSLILHEAMHYRLSVAPGLDYWTSLQVSLARLEQAN